MAPKHPKDPERFDAARLQVMEEPLTVRVEKLRGNMRTPIPLPPRDEAPPGQNWDQASVANLESWLVTEHAGGGSYEITVTDAKGTNMLWRAFYDPRQYPEKTPDTLSAGALPSYGGPPIQQSSMPALAVPQQQWAAPPGIWPPTGPGTQQAYQPLPFGGYPMAQQMMPPWAQPSWPPYQQAYPQPQPPVQQQSPYPASTQTFKGTADERLAMENRQIAAELQRVREERMESEHRSQLAMQAEQQRQQAAAHAQQLAELRTQMQQMNERKGVTSELDQQFSGLKDTIGKLAEALAKPTHAIDPALAVLTARLEQSERDRERDRDRAEADRRERDLRAEMQRTQDETRRMFESQNNKGPDPMIMFMQEATRQQAETARENLRVLSAAQQSQQAQIMTPPQMFDMMRNASGGTDQVLKSAVGVYNDLFAMFGQMMQMNGNTEHPAIRMAEAAGSKISALAERYLGGEQQKAIAASKAQQEASRAYQAQVQAAQAAQQAQVITPPPPVQHPQMPPHIPDTQQMHANGNGLNGAGVSQAAVPPIVAASAKASPKRHGHTDEDWFGMAVPDVEKLRTGVAVYIAAVQKHAKDGTTPSEGKEIDGVSAELAAEIIVKAAQQLEAASIPIKAFTDLLLESRYAEFLDVVLPNAPQAYRDDCVAALIDMIDDGEEDNAPVAHSLMTEPAVVPAN